MWKFDKALMYCFRFLSSQKRAPAVGVSQSQSFPESQNVIWITSTPLLAANDLWQSTDVHSTTLSFCICCMLGMWRHSVMYWIGV